MALKNLFDSVASNSYPGRGIVLGKSADGKNAVIAYFIMGRSENSRNRVFVDCGKGIRTQAFDESKLTDPSLVIYAPVRVCGDFTVVTNGDQTDTVCEYLEKGDTFENALRSRTFEPDPPHFTPRISGIVTAKGDYRLSILKSADGNPESARRYFYEYSDTIPGQGHFIHTYKCDGNPIPSFDGEPETVEIDGDIHSFGQKLWDSLNSDNKVSLFVRYISLEGKGVTSGIFNKHLEQGAM